MAASRPGSRLATLHCCIVALSAAVADAAVRGRNEALRLQAPVQQPFHRRLLEEESDEAADVIVEDSKPPAFLEIGTEAHIAALRSNMTTERALQRLPLHLRKAFGSLLGRSGSDSAQGIEREDAQTAGLRGATSFLQARSIQSTASLAAVAVAAKAATNASGVDAARQTLNKMAEETEAKLDDEKAKCATLSSKQQAMINDAYQDMTDYDAQGAAARGRIVEAQTIISRSEEDLMKLEEQMPKHHQKCMEDEESLKKEMGLVAKDAERLQSILGETKCGAGGSASSLLVCTEHVDYVTEGGEGDADDDEELPAYDEEVTHVNFRHENLRRKVAALSEIGKRVLERGLRQHVVTHQQKRRALRRRGDRERTPAQQHRARHAAPQKASKASPEEQLLEAGPRLRDAEDVAEEVENADEGNLADEMFLQTGRKRRRLRNMHRSRRVKRVRSKKCRTAASPTCDEMKDRFLNMRAEIEDKIDEMNAALASTVEMCFATEESFHSTTEELVMRLESAQLTLTQSTKLDTEAQAGLKLRTEQVAQLQDEGKKMQDECDKTLKSLALDMCGAKQIRQELYKLDSEKPFIQDCEVSRWTPEACSATCGGGFQSLRRSVIAPADKGTECPKLTMQKECGTCECPTDCSMEEWSGWSACTAKCGGGIKERVRTIRSQARHGGTPCGETTESVSCAHEPCDKDCGLSLWSPWSACTKACGGGFSIRERHVTTPAAGQGTCPIPEAPSRLQYKRCNPEKCAPAEGDTLKCDSKLDVVILLDSSGSVTSAGWEKLKTASATLVKAFNPDGDEKKARVAVLIYGGPDNFDTYQKCTKGDGTADIEKDCKISWASHFSADATSVSGGIGQLAWQKGATLTSAALAAAETELQTARPDATSVVIVLTDGRPINMRKTGDVAERVKKRARVMWVPITDKVPLEQMKTWASRPAASNVLALENFDELAKPDKINQILADACPKVK